MGRLYSCSANLTLVLKCSFNRLLILIFKIKEKNLPKSKVISNWFVPITFDSSLLWMNAQVHDD